MVSCTDDMIKQECQSPKCNTCYHTPLHLTQAQLRQSKVSLYRHFSPQAQLSQSLREYFLEPCHALPALKRCVNGSQSDWKYSTSQPHCKTLEHTIYSTSIVFDEVAGPIQPSYTMLDLIQHGSIDSHCNFISSRTVLKRKYEMGILTDMLLPAIF